MINLTELRRLHEAATKGPWQRIGADVYLNTNEIHWRICEGGNISDMDLIALAPDLAAACFIGACYGIALLMYAFGG